MLRKRTRTVSLFLLAFVLLWGCAGKTAQPQAEEAEDGFLNLSDRDLISGGPVSLDGDWAFYWDEWISPGSFAGRTPTGYYRLPSGWAKYRGLSLPVHGTATYRLVIETGADEGLYGLFVPNVYAEYALWANGALLHACGSFAGKQAVYLHPQTYSFAYSGSTLELVLQVKNDALVYGGGVGQSIRLGTQSAIERERDRWAAVDLFLSAICLFMGFFFLILHRYKKSGSELVWLSVLCFSVALRNLLSNTALLMQAFPDLPFWLGSKLVMLSVPAIIISMLFYTRCLYKDEMPRILFDILFSLNLLYLLIVLTLSSTTHTALFVPYLPSVAAACVLGCFVSVKALRGRKKESGYFLTGMLLLTLGALLDSLVYLGVLRVRYLLSAALFGFLLIQVVLLSKRYSEAFRNAELLSADLQSSLDQIMRTETAFLSAQMKPHFLYNALTVIAESCETDPDEAGRLILSLSKYLRQTLDYDNLSGIVPLKKELELVRAYAAIERARFPDIEIVFQLPEPLPSVQIPPLTLQPLVENAIRHGLRKKRGGGRVTVSITRVENQLQFTVEDNGVGMPAEVIKKLTVLPSGSVSIGLYNINARLVRLYGRGLTITGESGTGACVRFQIPDQTEG